MAISNTSELELIVIPKPMSYGVQVYLRRQEPNGDVYIGGLKDGLLTMEKIVEAGTPSEDIKPLFDIPVPFWEQIVQAFARHADQQGIETHKEQQLVGELRATKHHLADLQEAHTTLLSLVKKIKL